MVPNLQKPMFCLGCRQALSSGHYFSWPLLMTCQRHQSTQMPDCLLTTDFSIDMSRQFKTKPSSRKIYQRWRDGKKPLANEISPQQMHGHQNQHQQETDIKDQLSYTWPYIGGSRQQQVHGCHYQRGPRLEETH